MAASLLTADTRAADDTLATLRDRLTSGTRTWLEQFRAYMHERTSATFGSLARGGAFRGVTWAPFHGQASRQRGGASARLLDFTGALKRDALSSGSVDDDTLTWQTTVPYAAQQQARRPFLFFEIPADIERAHALAETFLGEAHESR